MIYSPNKTLHGNFKMYEVCKSRTAERLGINNTPSDKVLEIAEQTCIHIAQPVRNEFGSYSPNSWFRCEALEKVICANSFKKWCNQHRLDHNDESAWIAYFALKSHPKGESIDFEIASVSNMVLFNWCKLNLDYDQLIAEFMREDAPSAGWVHGSHSVDNNRHQSFDIR